MGLTKKGKEFFKLTSSLTEDIRNIVVEDTKIWTGCEFIYNVYDDGRDTAFYMSRDQINSLAIDFVTRESEKDAILACQDNVIRIIQGSTLTLEIPTDAAVTSVVVNGSDYSKVNKRPTSILYGMENGAFGAVSVSQLEGFKKIWSIEDSTKRSQINSMQYFDLTKDGTDDIILGRDDGRLEVYSLEGGVGKKPTLVFSKDIGESIRSTECGQVNSETFNEVILSTYSGRILSFTAEPVLQRAPDDNYGRSIQTVNNENRIKHLKKELDDLKKQVGGLRYYCCLDSVKLILHQ